MRELKNLIERAVLLHKGEGLVKPDDLPLEMRLGIGMDTIGPQGDDSVEGLNLDTVVRDAETRAIQRAFKAAGGSKQRTAELLGISPRTLRHKLAQYKMKL